MVKWYPSANLDAQLSHVGWGAFLCLAFAPWIGWERSFAFFLLWTVVKEFALDLIFETGETVRNSLIDFVFWWVGAVIGFGVFFLQRSVQ